jgi:precorrin-3B synthase
MASMLLDWLHKQESSVFGTPYSNSASGRPSVSPLNPVEAWKAKKHGFDVWPDVLNWAAQKTSYDQIDEADLHRMKWYGVFWRKEDRDRYMLRVRIPACEMTAAQARALAGIAHESGHEIVDVTTRGNIQIQGLTIDKVPGVIGALNEAGLTSKQTGLDNVRNVTSHPFAGFDPAELIDTRDLARAVTDLFLDNRDLANLPRKFNVAFNGRADNAPAEWTQDIAWLAAFGPDSTVGFRLLLGGTQGQAPHLGWHVPVFVRPDQVTGVTLQVLRIFQEMGSRSARRNQVRFRFLIESLGLDRILQEIEQRIGYPLTRFPTPPPAPRETESFIGWFPQRQPDRCAVGVAIPMGRLTWQQMEGLAAISAKHGDGTIRTTTDQNLVLPGISATDKDALAMDLAALGLSFEADSLTRQTVACTGKQFCSLALTEAKGYAFEMIEDLRRRQLELHGIRIAISGCANSCAQHHTSDIGLRGIRVRKGQEVLDAFDIYLGGGIGKSITFGILYLKGVPFKRIADTLDKIVREFYRNRVSGESFSAFWQRTLTDRQPETVLPEEVPTWRCANCSYDHVAQSPPGFCPRCAGVKRQFALFDGSPAPTATSTHG